MLTMNPGSRLGKSLASLAKSFAKDRIKKGGLAKLATASTTAGPQKREKKRNDRDFVSAARSAQATVIAAPVAMGMSFMGPQYHFGAAPSQGGLHGVRLSGRQLWCTIATNATASTNKQVLLPFAAALNSSVDTLTFDPDDTKTMPPPMTSLSQVFGRYVLRKCRLVFTPSTSTSSGGGMALAVLTDAASIAAVSAPSFFFVMEQSNSVTGPLWAPMSLDVPCDGVLRYTYQSVADASLSVAEERQDHAFGLVGAQNTAASSSTVYGYLHIEYVLDFYEVIAQTNEASLRRKLREVSQLQAALAEAKHSSVSLATSHVESKVETVLYDSDSPVMISPAPSSEVGIRASDTEARRKEQITALTRRGTTLPKSGLLQSG
jgi:hypothetical protein